METIKQALIAKLTKHNLQSKYTDAEIDNAIDLSIRRGNVTPSQIANDAINFLRF